MYGISASFYTAFFYTTLYFQQVVGLSAIQAGLASLPATTVVFIVIGETARLGQRAPAWR